MPNALKPVRRCETTLESGKDKRKCLTRSTCQRVKWKGSAEDVRATTEDDCPEKVKKKMMLFKSKVQEGHLLYPDYRESEIKGNGVGKGQKSGKLGHKSERWVL